MLVIKPGSIGRDYFLLVNCHPELVSGSLTISEMLKQVQHD